MALFARKKPEPPPAPEHVVEASVPDHTLDAHLAVLLDGVEPLRPFGMQINDVAGLTLCEDIVSDIDLPMVSTALVAGYGVRASNIVGATEAHPIDLRVVGVVDRRDMMPTQAVAAGGCVLLAEGAAVPKGVDAVVALEDAQLTGRVVTFLHEVRMHENVSVRGSALADGALLMQAGTVLDARAIGLLAEIGLDKVLVRPKPRLVVFAVGPDLVAPGLPLTSLNQRYSAAASMITAAARADGATVYTLDIVGQDASAIRQALTDQAIRADAMVVLAESDADARLVADTMGGVGDVQRAHVLFNGGQSMATARTGDEEVPVLVVPAGAVSAYVAYHLLLRPLLDRLGARAAAPAPRRRARLTDGVRADPIDRYVPAVLAGDEVRLLAGGDELAYDLFRADALALVPGGPALDAGAEVECVVLAGGVVGGVTAPAASE